MTLPADVSRCANPDCVRRPECARAVPPPAHWERVTWSTFPDTGCTYFIEILATTDPNKWAFDRGLEST